MKIEGHLNIIEQELKSLRVRLKDSVEVVRCKDCKHYVNDRLKKDYSEDKRFKRRVCVVSEYAKLRDPNWFCADGERREDERRPYL